MLKIVVFDSGFGGELFADYLEEELPIVEVIRVIDWRNAEKIQTSPKEARRLAKIALRPYIGKVDLIVFANHLLTITSLKHFQRKYKNQLFLGLKLKYPEKPPRGTIFILTTKAVSKTINYHNYLFHIKYKTKTIILDTWPAKIDDGELTEDEIAVTLCRATKDDYCPKEVVLACAQFQDIKTELRKVYGHNLKIYDSFKDSLREICKTLKIRGITGRKIS